MERHVLLYSVYGGGPPPLPPTPVVEEEVVEEDDPWNDPEEIREYLRDVDRRVELGQERHRQNKAANDFAMRAIAFGIAGTIITRS